MGEGWVEGHASVDGQGGSDHIVGDVGDQPDGGGGHFLGFPDAIVGDQLQKLAHRRRRAPGGFVDGRANGPGGDGVDPDLFGREFLGHGLHQHLHPALGGGVVGVAGPGDSLVDRAYEQHLAHGLGSLGVDPLAAETPHSLLGGQEGAAQVQIDHRPPVGEAEFGEGPVLLHSGVGDEDVHATEMFARDVEQPLDIAGARDVGGGGDRAALRGQDGLDHPSGGVRLAVVVDHHRRAGLGDIERLFDVAGEHFGGVDILVANAGMQKDGAFTELSLADWRAVIDLDLGGAFLTAQEAVRRFRRQGIDPKRSKAMGKVLFVSSVHQTIPWAGHANYAAAKGGVKMLMETMAQELSPEKIRVNAIAPGAIRTPINKAAWSTPAAMRKLMKLIPYDRIGEAEEVAAAAVWLVSDVADYVVGTTLAIDGGMSLYPSFAHGG